MFLGVDLAAKFSAGVLLDEGGEVRAQFDSWHRTPFEFVNLITYYGSAATDIVIEDVPYGISSQAMTKPVLRLQGILIHALGLEGLLERTVFLLPSTWQRSFEGVWKGGPKGAEAAAQRLGYTHPDMLALHAEQIPPLKDPRRAKVRADLKKASTDYDDGYLIAHWARSARREGPLTAVKGVQPVFL